MDNKELYEYLKSRIAYAKSSRSPRELLYQTHGEICMAERLNAITRQQYLELEHEAVAEGINNPKYFRDKEIAACETGTLTSGKE